MNCGSEADIRNSAQVRRRTPSRAQPLKAGETGVPLAGSFRPRSAHGHICMARIALKVQCRDRIVATPARSCSRQNTQTANPIGLMHGNADFVVARRARNHVGARGLFASKPVRL